MTWKIGVNRKASRLTGSAPGGDGLRGCCAEAVGVGGPPEAPGDPEPGKQPATTTARTTSRSGPSHARASARRLADGVIAAGAPGVAPSDPPCSHPASAKQAVALDRLLRIAR